MFPDPSNLPDEVLTAAQHLTGRLSDAFFEELLALGIHADTVTVRVGGDKDDHVPHVELVIGAGLGEAFFRLDGGKGA